MTRRACPRACPSTPDLLSWEPEQPAIALDAAAISRVTPLRDQICRALKVTLAEDGRTRAEICDAINAATGDRFGEDSLNACVSQGREDVVINAERLFALVQVTRDPRVLSIALDAIGMVIIDRKYLPYIALAQLAEREAEIAAYQEDLARQKDQLRRQVRAGGRP